MNWEVVGAVAELLGAIAVLATLIYLSIQVSQARRLQQAEGIRASRAERREFFSSIRDSPYIPDILDKIQNEQELSWAEQHRVDNHYATYFGVLYSSWVQEKLDLVGGFNSNVTTNFNIVMSLPGAKAWIEQYGQHLYSEEFINQLHEAESDGIGI